MPKIANIFRGFITKSQQAKIFTTKKNFNSKQETEFRHLMLNLFYFFFFSNSIRSVIGPVWLVVEKIQSSNLIPNYYKILHDENVNNFEPNSMLLGEDEKVPQKVVVIIEFSRYYFFPSK